MLKTFDEIVEIAKKKKAVVSLAGAEDVEALKAIREVLPYGIKAILVGNREIISKNLKELDLDLPIVDAKNEAEIAEKAVKLVSSGEANILMKGLVKTATLLKAVLNKEWGLRGEGLLSHVALLETPGLDRIVLVTDGGMVIRPTLEQKIQIIKNAVELAHKLGYEKPRVGLIAAVEVVNPDMPETMEAAIISKMAERGQIKGCFVDGPLGIDNALSEFAAKVKKVSGEVAGKADILVVPDIHSGNFLGKSAVYLAKGKIAGIIMGAKAPIVIVSRADTSESKKNSIAIAAAISSQGGKNL
ncbi:phosphate butyryltransferase [Thermosipho melanesiensis]|uniref:Phosphate butyryltransferase n=2 Tax=Thermosipho melanesiensis TaxID=46541 RepID=A6LPA9_THEM4|nr:bifunctional enoyl-CoA hydratase/phosphate acetyltransferase [Thermosipho melanesiensis]ABR31760.1 Phosphate butyryltransferase [Thermosipho melanesiensis BI429]APT74782.1 phosphate butyryltransferase [Thermosipho melanesiensis]OOC35099.1 phosphate butyryltransferase [Thermosipho melanesiensis]OOC35135.1 phosphate butyryltransferase [Thermosipho melanesiensis]OOC36743.1 phosphate butyryltransferase [Thermosipho melanesiensis]